MYATQGELTLQRKYYFGWQHARLDAFVEIKAQRNITTRNTIANRRPGDLAAGDIVKGDKTVVYAVKPEKKPPCCLLFREPLPC